MERDIGTAIVAPGESAVDDDPLGYAPGIDILVAHQVIAAPHWVAEDRGVPIDRPGQGARVGVDEELSAVEAMPGLRFPRSVDTIAIPLTGADARKIAVPDVGRHLTK